MIVIKFGGTSVGDAQHMRRAIDIVAAARHRQPTVVVSALSGVTNQLVEATLLAAAGRMPEVRTIVEEIRRRHEEIGYEMVRQKSDYLESFLSQLRSHTDQIADILKGISLVGEVSLRARDKIVAIGEKLSSVLFSYTMRLKTLTGVHIDSEEVVVTDENFGAANPRMEETRRAAQRILVPEIQRNHIPVMGGFIGRATNGATTTLGRGGSDYSAAVLGAALGAEEIQIWTDVDGMMTCDPRLIAAAKVIDHLSYEEAAELAYFGAKVLHPKTIAPAVDQKIPIRVLNTHNVDSAGTLITAEGPRQRNGPRAIALKKAITVVHMTSNQMLGTHGFLARIFDVFATTGVSVDLITTSEVSVSVTIDQTAELQRLVTALSEFAAVEIRDSQAIIAVVGRAAMNDASVGATILSALAGVPITMMSLGTSGLNLSVVVPDRSAEAAVKKVHAALFEKKSEEAA
jgi:aspartate kinase